MFLDAPRAAVQHSFEELCRKQSASGRWRWRLREQMPTCPRKAVLEATVPPASEINDETCSICSIRHVTRSSSAQPSTIVWVHVDENVEERAFDLGQRRFLGPSPPLRAMVAVECEFALQKHEHNAIQQRGTCSHHLMSLQPQHDVVAAAAPFNAAAERRTGDVDEEKSLRSRG